MSRVTLQLQHFLFASQPCSRRRSLFTLFGGNSSDHRQTYHERKILPYGQREMYELVADVDSYRFFVPYCIASRVLKRIRSDETNDKTLKLEALLRVGFLGLEEEYVSNVECRPYEMVQAVAAAQTPLFKSLATTWRFQPASSTSPHPTADIASTLYNPEDSGNGPTLLTFDLEYALANALHARVSNAFFSQVSKMMVRAFEERCMEVYGPGVEKEAFEANSVFIFYLAGPSLNVTFVFPQKYGSLKHVQKYSKGRWFGQDKFGFEVRERHDLMDVPAIIARVAAIARKDGIFAIQISLGAAVFLCFPVFLAAGTFVFVFVILPLTLLVFAPVQIARVVLDLFAPKPAPARTRRESYRRSSGSSSASQVSSSVRSANTQSSFRARSRRSAPRYSPVESVKDTPRSILGLTFYDYDYRESDRDFNSQSTRVVEPVFVESPEEIIYAIPPRSKKLCLERLSEELLEVVARHLPEETISTLALVSKRFGSRFRFRRIHSGTEHCALPTFLAIKQNPQLGEHTTRMVVHETYFRPPARVQWLLEGSDESVSKKNWTSTELKKQGLLEDVLRACPRIRALKWNEGRLPLSPGVLSAIQGLCTTSLRHLDLPVGCRVISHLNESMASESLRLDSLVLRGGYSEGSSSAIIKFFLLSTAIRRVRFERANTGNSRDDFRSIMRIFLQENSSVRRVEFVEPCEFEGTDIPINYAHELIIRHPIFRADPPPDIFHPYDFRIPVGITLSNLTGLILQAPKCAEDIRDWIPSPPILTSPEAIQSISDIVTASPNLRVLSTNSRFVPGWWTDYCPIIDQNMISAIISRPKLVSLGLTAYKLTPEQYVFIFLTEKRQIEYGANSLQAICESLPRLQHFCMVMAGEAVEISTYSQHFSKLSNLTALDVSLICRNKKCACGHERDPRIAHQDEGTALGRLCRRFESPTAPAIVRLFQDGWTPPSYPMDYPTGEIRWTEPYELSISKLDEICGFCENPEEVIYKIFDPMTWLDVL